MTLIIYLDLLGEPILSYLYKICSDWLMLSHRKFTLHHSIILKTKYFGPTGGLSQAVEVHLVMQDHVIESIDDSASDEMMS